MRLVGATPRQVSVISAVESAVAADRRRGGRLRPVLPAPPGRWRRSPSPASRSSPATCRSAWPTSCSSPSASRSPPRWRRASRCGGCTSRRSASAGASPRAPPRAYRVIPLLAGIGELAYFVGVGHPASTDGQIEAYFAGILLIMAGLVIAGPWLTMIGSRVMARRASRPAALIAGRRLADNPAGRVPGHQRAHPRPVRHQRVRRRDHHDRRLQPRRRPARARAARDTLVDQFLLGRGSGVQAPLPPRPGSRCWPKLHSIRGVQGVTEIHAESLRHPGQPRARLPRPAEPGLLRAARPHPGARPLRDRGSGRRDHRGRSRGPGPGKPGRLRLARRRHLPAARAAPPGAGDRRGHGRVSAGDRAGPDRPRAAYPYQAILPPRSASNPFNSTLDASSSNWPTW